MAHFPVLHMDVPWQCPRCSLHNISSTCAACLGPRPNTSAPHTVQNDDDFVAALRDEVVIAPEPVSRASLGSGRGVTGPARPWPVSAETDSAQDDTGFLTRNAAAAGTTFNAAEMPQEFNGIGQQQPQQGQAQARPPWWQAAGITLPSSSLLFGVMAA